MTQPAADMRRLVAKFALLLAFIYLLVLMAGVFRAVRGPALPAAGWPLFLVPAAAFVPAVVVAVRLLRTSDAELARVLCPRCAVYSVAGVALIIASVVALNVMSPS